MKTSQITCTSMILTDLCFTKQRIKIINTFCQSCLQCFSSTNILTEHKEVCLGINGAQSGRLEKGTIEFKSYFKQILVLLKVQGRSQNEFVSSASLNVKKCWPPWLADGENF